MVGQWLPWWSTYKETWGTVWIHLKVFAWLWREGIPVILKSVLGTKVSNPNLNLFSSIECIGGSLKCRKSGQRENWIQDICHFLSTKAWQRQCIKFLHLLYVNFMFRVGLWVLSTSALLHQNIFLKISVGWMWWWLSLILALWDQR